MDKTELRNRILFITAYTPSEVGAAVKNTKYMLRELSRNFDVDLIYFKDGEDSEYLPTNDNIRVVKVVMNSTLNRVKNALRHFVFYPLFTVRYNNSLKRFIQEQIDNNNYCAIVFDHSQTFMYARNLKFNGIKVMLSHDIEAQRVKRSSNYLMYRMCLLTEKYLLSTPYAQLFALSQKDADLIKNLYGFDAKVSLIYIDDKISSIVPVKSVNEFAMMGTWDRPDNFEGALWLINGLSKFLTKPITINIIGSKFPINKIVDTDMIHLNVLGFVVDPYPLISECKAMLCPLFSGAGIKVKVIDSLACGTPVIGTEIAFEGFSKKYESFLIRCEDLSSFAHEIESINFTLEERVAFKNLFNRDYKSMTIPNWLESSVLSKK